MTINRDNDVELSGGEGPMDASETLKAIEEALASRHLTMRGVVRLKAGDPLWPEGYPSPPQSDGTCTIVLIGHLGGAFWQTFWQEKSDTTNPLDSWSRNILDSIARQIGATLIMPNDRPYQPFQQWALQSNRVFRSPLGLLIDPEAGLWHAFRGALVLPGSLASPLEAAGSDMDQIQSPCLSCREKPCLSACPVNAFSDDAPMKVDACRGHLAAQQPPNCLEIGCRARDACPVGIKYRYSPAQIAFHMAAFAGR